MTLSVDGRKAVFAQQTDEVFVLLMTITAPTLTDPIRISTDPTVLLPLAGVRGTVSNGEEYIYLPVSISLPVQDDTGIARAKVSIDNVGRDIVAAVRSAGATLSVDMQIVLASAPDVIEMEIVDFRLERVKYDALTITGELSVEYFDLEPYSKGEFTPSKWAGIF
jgi:hypothetical protein